MVTVIRLLCGSRGDRTLATLIKPEYQSHYIAEGTISSDETGVVKGGVHGVRDCSRSAHDTGRWAR